MADISQDLQEILDAIYGEQVRGSIYHAISLINDVSEVVLTVGTAVDSPTSSSTGFFEDSLYINTDNWELWQCVGTDAWVSQGKFDGNGIADIEKTGTTGLVDTYTITFTKGTTPRTFTVTNGEDGNTWYHGTTISGGAVLPTVYPTSGIANAKEGDFYLNSDEGYVYVCISGGDANTATWSYLMALSGGGVSHLVDLDDVDVDPLTLSNKDILEYDAATQKFKNVSDRSFVRYAGSISFALLMSGALTTYLSADYEDMFFLVTDGGVLDSTTAAYWTGTYSVGDVIPADSHIAVINIAPAGSTPSYRFDDFGGYVDISGKADKTQIIQWVEGTVSNATSVVLPNSGTDSRITSNTKVACILMDDGTNNPVKYSTIANNGNGTLSITFPKATTASIAVGISNT